MHLSLEPGHDLGEELPELLGGHVQDRMGHICRDRRWLRPRLVGLEANRSRTLQPGIRNAQGSIKLDPEHVNESAYDVDRDPRCLLHGVFSFRICPAPVTAARVAHPPATILI